MIQRYCFLFFMILMINSCAEQTGKEERGLIKLTDEELLERARNKKLVDMANIVYQNIEGKVISRDSANAILASGNWFLDNYANSLGEVKVLRIRRKTLKDDDFQKKLLAIYTAKPPVKIVPVDCSQMAKILDTVYDLDQKGRADNSEDFQEHDENNLALVVSLIEKCGMPTLKEVDQRQMDAIWYVFQHSDNVNRKKYFKYLETAADNGDLTQGQIAKTKDRILFSDGMPQVYGTQLIFNEQSNKLELYKLDRPHQVDKRRAEVGLGPIREFLVKFDIEFDIDQYD